MSRKLPNNQNLVKQSDDIFHLKKKQSKSNPTQPNQTESNRTHPNPTQLQPNQTKPNQTKSNQIKSNQKIRLFDEILVTVQIGLKSSKFQ